MSNVFEAHLLPRRSRGDVEIVRLSLFTPDGAPIDLPDSPQSGSGVPNGGTTGQALVKISDDDGDADWADVTGVDVLRVGDDWIFNGEIIEERPAVVRRLFWIGGGLADDPVVLMDNGDVWIAAEMTS